MFHRLAPLGRLAAIVAALAFGIAACGGGAAPTTSPAGGTTPAPATPVPGDLPSFDIPSFEADLDLEAQLPSEFCGQPTQKLSFAGSDAVGNDETFAAIVAALGRSAADVSVAVASVEGPECEGISLIAFRIQGADAGRFEQLFIDAQEEDTGTRPTRTNVGGKDVWFFTDSADATNYIYFRGDTIYGATAESQGDAARGLAALP